MYRTATLSTAEQDGSEHFHSAYSTRQDSGPVSDLMNKIVVTFKSCNVLLGLQIFRLILNFLKNSLCSIHFSLFHHGFVLASCRVHGEVSSSPRASPQQILLVVSMALSQFGAERSLGYQWGDAPRGTPLLVLKSESSPLPNQPLHGQSAGCPAAKGQQRCVSSGRENTHSPVCVYLRLFQQPLGETFFPPYSIFDLRQPSNDFPDTQVASIRFKYQFTY